MVVYKVELNSRARVGSKAILPGVLTEVDEETFKLLQQAKLVKSFVEEHSEDQDIDDDTDIDDTDDTDENDEDVEDEEDEEPKTPAKKPSRRRKK